jgi:hypothetical protein
METIEEKYRFNYVIARRWCNKRNELSCYTFHTTVFYGNMKDANHTLEFIRGRADYNPEEYEIYKISDEPLK